MLFRVKSTRINETGDGPLSYLLELPDMKNVQLFKGFRAVFPLPKNSSASSSNPSIVKCTVQGDELTVEALAVGDARLSLSLGGDFSASLDVSVRA